MIQRKLFIIILSICFLLNKSTAQSKGYKLDFDSNDWAPSYSHPDFTVKNKDGILVINTLSVGSDYENFVGYLPKTDLSSNPFVYVKIKTQYPVKFQLRLLDNANKETNDNNPSIPVSPDNEYKWMTFDFTNKFKQSWPANDTVNSREIVKFSIILNAGGPDYTGWVNIDEIVFGDSNSVKLPFDPIVYQPKVNQLGYLIKNPKVAIIPSNKMLAFQIIEKTTKTSVFSSTTSSPSKWQYSEESVVKADFSELEQEGHYYLLAEGLKASYDFTISDTVLNGLQAAVIKAFYFNRASMDITVPYGGKWSRANGHPDDKVLIHSSAASDERPEGTVISCPKGWYDAGDYNKYVVPAGISVWQLLSSWEYFRTETNTMSLTIPESNNNLPDILDEALWEIEWLQTMQDPADGGVYHKLTNAEFDPMVMPEDATTPRYVVKKTTPATLNFASMLTKASRIYRQFPEYKTDITNTWLAQAENAWDWAVAHPEEQYDQDLINQTYEPNIHTGDYGLQSYNVEWADEWFWAAVELYIATGKLKYLNKINFPDKPLEVPKWSNTEFMGIISMIKNKDKFSSYEVEHAENRLIKFANVLNDYAKKSPYATSMGTMAYDFGWNSNANAANHSMILLHAYELTENKDYFNTAIMNIDYLLGRNPLNYCFVTGFGTQSPQHIHHRISSADGVTEPVPGLIVNGPHNDDLSFCTYPTTIPAFTYLDDECSAPTNEVAININSALVYSLNALKSIYSEKILSPVKKKTSEEKIALYPNPNDGTFEIAVPEIFKNGQWKLINTYGNQMAQGVLSSETKQRISFHGIHSGLYILIFNNEGKSSSIKVKIY
ncbi:hypothetical protein MYP_1436 [Sporocytophaga myxococcoides]|uniref:Endoglucanase n=1 Tax=Sporocytophaga myxococcoides TaxID=153721 RepID=A0A098LCV6_9BACT|nr:glycoside hydrolase family 9 protein [Sporocytophaga myxococcoides]GAL84208.1 hypothetical protein MYP_1436 [Sporocytophaga myxococcoides]